METEKAIKETIKLLEACGAMDKIKEKGGEPFLHLALQNIARAATHDTLIKELKSLETN